MSAGTLTPLVNSRDHEPSAGKVACDVPKSDLKPSRKSSTQDTALTARQIAIAVAESVAAKSTTAAAHGSMKRDDLLAMLEQSALRKASTAEENGAQRDTTFDLVQKDPMAKQYLEDYCTTKGCQQYGWIE